MPVRKLSHSGKLGQHESKLGKVKQDWYALSMKLGDLISAVTRLSKMKRKPRLADYIDLDLLQVNLEFLHSTLAPEYLLNVEGKTDEEIGFQDFGEQLRELLEFKRGGDQ